MHQGDPRSAPGDRTERALGAVAQLVRALDITAPQSRPSRLAQNLWALVVAAVLGTDDRPLVESCTTLDDLVEVTRQRIDNGTRPIGSHGVLPRPGRLVGSAVTDGDMPTLYDAWTSSDRAEYWRFRGSTPHPGRFRDLVYEGVQSHRLYRDRGSGEPVSYCAAYRYSLASRSVYFSYCRIGTGGGPLVGLESAVDFLSSVALQLPIRRCYVELPTFTAAHLGDPPGFPLIPVGTFPEHVYWRGAWHDVMVYSVEAATLVGPGAALARLLGMGSPVHPEGEAGPEAMDVRADR